VVRSGLAVVLVLVPGAFAFAEGQAIALKAGALGLGVEYTHEVGDRVAIRGGFNGSRLGFGREESGIRYDFNLVWDSWSVAADFHPLKGPFRVSGGVLGNRNRLEGSSRPTADITVGDNVYTPSEVGTLTGRVSFRRASPFVGVGWDWWRRKKFFGTSLDLGVLSQGAPKVSLVGSGTLLGDPQFQADIETERGQLADSLGRLDLVPYLSVGFALRF
jgi:hypothetical protein